MPQPPEDGRGSPDAGRGTAPRGRPLIRLRPAGRNLTLAVGSAVVFAALFLVVTFISTWALVLFVSVIVVIAILEVDGALRSTGVRPPTIVVLVGGVALMICAFRYGAGGQLLTLALTCMAGLVWSLFARGDGQRLRNAGAGVLMTLWVPFLASFLSLLARRDGGDWYVVITVALTAASDIAAYAFGSQLGRHKLAPAVSPGKTWEGFIGGVLVTMAVAGIGAPLIVDELSPARAAALGALVAVVATIGDLAESAVKRSLGVKDLGRLLPGHGGMMDRVDAMLFTLPVAHLVLLAGGL